jgi:hypothetical protein
MNADNKLRILCFDGGEVGGLSSLYVLNDIFKQIQREQRPDDPTNSSPVIRPCDIFDLICGTGSGGLIALMLGRLGMVLPHCFRPGSKNLAAVYISISVVLLRNRLSKKQ